MFLLKQKVRELFNCYKFIAFISRYKTTAIDWPEGNVTQPRDITCQCCTSQYLYNIFHCNLR